MNNNFLNSKYLSSNINQRYYLIQKILIGDISDNIPQCLIYSEYLLSKNFDLNKVILKTNYFEKKYKLEEANWFTYNFQIWDYLLKNKTFHEYLEIYI